jgi:hypothetical protein
MDSSRKGLKVEDLGHASSAPFLVLFDYWSRGSAMDHISKLEIMTRDSLPLKLPLLRPSRPWYPAQCLDHYSLARSTGTAHTLYWTVDSLLQSTLPNLAHHCGTGTCNQSHIKRHSQPPTYSKCRRPRQPSMVKR